VMRAMRIMLPKMVRTGHARGLVGSDQIEVAMSIASRIETFSASVAHGKEHDHMS
jgi:hypothetical protein